MKFVFSIALFLIACTSFAQDEAPEHYTDEVPIVLRSPAGFTTESSADIKYFENNKIVKAISYNGDWVIGEVVAVESRSEGVGVVGFLEITDIRNKQDGGYELTCELLRQSRSNFVQVRDKLFHVDLSSTNPRYRGTTDLLIKKRNRYISSKYKPLFTQGVSVGQTAEALWQGEFFATWYGELAYGITDTITVSSVLSAILIEAPNATAKWRFHSSDSNTLAASLIAAKIPKSQSADGKTEQTTLNLNLNWDSISSENTVSHTLLSLALLTFDNAEDATAIKSLGTSSFQTGYEFILGNWDRILMGPNYNFEKKAVGGYLSYLKIWDRFHLGISLNSTNISSFKYSPSDGYYLAGDAYWRF
jgi:hypothetical protein